MIAQPITVVTDINHDGVFSQARFFQRNHQAPDLMVDQGNLTVCICDNLAELVVGLLLNPAIVLAYVSRLFGPDLVRLSGRLHATRDALQKCALGAVVSPLRPGYAAVPKVQAHQTGGEDLGSEPTS